MRAARIDRRGGRLAAAVAAAGVIAAIVAPGASADSITLAGDGKFTAKKAGGATAAKLFTLTVTCTVNCAGASPGMVGLQVTTTGPFAVASNSCPATFTTKTTTSCTIGVVFAPTGKGRSSGSLNVTGTAYLDAPPPRPATYSSALSGTVAAAKKCKGGKKGKKGAASAAKCGKGKK